MANNWGRGVMGKQAGDIECRVALVSGSIKDKVHDSSGRGAVCEVK